jgi:4'-phosphopantetheinyl transferase
MPGPILPEGEAHVWYVRPEEVGPDLLDACRELMAPEEVERQQRYRFERERRQQAITRALVRTTLSRYHPIAPRAWRFRVTPSGRPEIVREAGVPPLRFNVSHTAGLIVCGVTLERDIGVDVEGSPRRGLTLEIATRFFAPSEVEALRAGPAAERPRRLVECWTLKEAYIKAQGKGLSIPLDAFSVDVKPGRPVRISFDDRLDDDPEAWQLERLVLTPSHVLGVALRRGTGPDCTVRLEPALPRWVRGGLEGGDPSSPR